ncbi:MAG: helix-turn-helix domain-containing protein [Xanthobacteraceae bacterium]
MPTEDFDPFNGLAHGDIVFFTPGERTFFIGRLSPSQQKQWLHDRPKRWRTRKDALRDLRAQAGIDVEAKPADPCSTTSANEVRASGQSDGPLSVPGKDKWLPDRPATNTAPVTIADPEATAAADDEIIIGERRFISERRVAAMLGYSQRQLQRWRKEQKGPPSTKIGRRLFYEINKLQEWIEREKLR